MDISDLIQLHLPFVSKTLRVSDILPSLIADGIISEECKEEIMQIGSEYARAEKLMQTILNDDEPGWQTTLTRALDLKGYKILLHILEEPEAIVDQEIYTACIDMCLEDLVQVIPTDVYVYLRSQGCISENDQIRNEYFYQRHGSELAVLDLLRTIRKHPYWMAHLLTALQEVNSEAYNNIIKEVEPRLEKAGYSIQARLEQLVQMQKDGDHQYTPETTEILVSQSSDNVADQERNSREPPSKTTPIKLFETQSSKLEGDVDDVGATASAPFEMDQRHKDILVNHRIFLLHNVQVGDVQDYLLQKRILLDDDVESYNKRLKQESERNVLSSLLYRLKQGGPSAFNSFKEALAQCGSDKSHVIKKLEDEEIKAEISICSHFARGATRTNDPSETRLKAIEDRPHNMHTEGTETTLVETTQKKLSIQSDCIDSSRETYVLDATLESSKTADSQINDRSEEIRDTIITEDDKYEIEDLPMETLVLKPFQQELAESCLQGENRIIVAPTNSGKTFVAMAIAENAVLKNKQENFPQKVVVFIAPKRCLVQQQWRQFHTYLPNINSYYLLGGSMDNNEQRVNMDIMKRAFDVVLATPQVLVENLKRGAITLDEIACLIFDECHNARGKNPMSVLTTLYILDKQAGKSVPQVVGLTASVGLGKLKAADMKFSARSNILDLCAMFDSPIQLVSNQQSDLDKQQKTKTEMLVKVPTRKRNTFQTILADVMHEVEKRVLGFDGMEGFNFPHIGTAAYVQRIETTLKDPTERGPARPAIFACLEYLLVYNAAYQIYTDVEARFALQYIQQQITELMPDDNMLEHEVDMWLYEHFKDIESILKEIANGDSNPKLNRLKDILLQRLATNCDESTRPQAMVMVSTRQLTTFLEQFLKEDTEMNEEGLSICRLVGGAGGDGSMTDGEKKLAMDRFREGRVRVLVCTNVAQEGINIKTCSLVINYERHHTETSMVQSGGRTRADDSILVELFSDELVFANNRIVKAKVTLMNESVKAIFNTPKELLRKEIATRQKIIVNDEKARQKDEEVGKRNQGICSRYKFLCVRYEAVVCDGKDVACHNESSHVVLDESIWNRVVIRPLKRGRAHNNIGGLVKEAKVYCKNCKKQDWGVKARVANKMVVVLKKGVVMLFNKDLKRNENLDDWKKLEFEEIGTNEIIDRCCTDDENYGQQ